MNRRYLDPNTLAALVIVVSIIAFVALALADVADGGITDGPTAGPTIEVGEPELKIKPCTVSASIYNPVVRKLNAIKGKKVRHGIHGRIACAKYEALKVRLKRARADCLRRIRYATASHYGDGDGFLGGPLACGGHLYAGQIGTAHKTLPCGTILYFRTAGGDGLRVPVIDRGPYIAGREFDLTSWTAYKVGTFDGVGTVMYATTNCWA